MSFIYGLIIGFFFGGLIYTVILFVWSSFFNDMKDVEGKDFYNR